MYASVSAEHFEGTTEYDCRIHGDDCYGCVYESSWVVPYAQHNRANRALLHFRSMHGGKTGQELLQAATAWAASLPSMIRSGAYDFHTGMFAQQVLLRLNRAARDLAN